MNKLWGKRLKTRVKYRSFPYYLLVQNLLFFDVAGLQILWHFWICC